MVTTTISAALQGINATPVYCETTVSPGCRVSIIGLPDAAVKESRDRIESALHEIGMQFPRKSVTVNLAPADVRKEGSLYDVPIAIAVLAAAGHVVPDKLNQYMLVGELSLDGSIKAVKGCLPYAILARSLHLKGIIVPRDNAVEAAVVDNLDVLIADNLRQLVNFLSSRGDLELKQINTRELFFQAQQSFTSDFADVKGQTSVKRAFTVAAAGGHNLIMIGPPGAGKSMMAKCMPSILPPLSLGEALETTKIHSVSGLRSATGLITQRPFRSPHHTVSSVALAGGGPNPMPGEISLAHNGVLYMDELPEFKREALEILRQPLEDRQIQISRVKNSFTYPASVQLIASMNPCPCGYYNHPTHPCSCTPTQVRKYLNRISGPLLDRIDLQIEILPLSFDEVSRTAPGETSAQMREKVVQARNIQVERFREWNAPHPEGQRVHCNAQMNAQLERQYCQLDETCLSLLRRAMARLDLSARAYDRILKIARTCADLAGRQQIETYDIAEAISYRKLDRKNWGE